MILGSEDGAVTFFFFNLSSLQLKRSLGWVKLALVGDTSLASSRVGLCVGEKEEMAQE